MFNDNPWNKKEEMKEKAREHTQKMSCMYEKEIQYSIKNTCQYDSKSQFQNITKKHKIKCQISVKNHTATEVIIQLAKKNSLDKIAVLNFASYKHPGGMFFNGSIAQEEALCHSSFLYNVLKEFQESYYDENSKRKNKALYTDKALYSQNIIFSDEDNNYYCDVITCAAPNYSTAKKYNHISESENLNALEKRIDFILKIAKENNVDRLILGAWGCGVFGQNPKKVACLFKKNLKKYQYSFKEVVFAIPYSKNGNYSIFKNMFQKNEIDDKR